MTSRKSSIWKKNKRYVFFTWAKQSETNPIVITKARGIYFWDDQRKKYLDFTSQLVNVNLGHRHPNITAAIKKQANKLLYVAPSFATDVKGELGEFLIKIAPKNLAKVLFTCGGGEANENAIKIARAYSGKFKIISRTHSYHGATYGAFSVSSDSTRPMPSEHKIPGVISVPTPYCYRCPFKKTKNNCFLECLGALAETISVENPNTIAAIIIEPIPGGNGVLTPPDDYLPKLQKLCNKNKILLICDEVMTGFGRTGSWFAVDHWKVTPDIITLAKGITSAYIPLGAVLVSKKISDFFESHKYFGGLTNSGHPLGCATALETIRTYQRRNIISRTKKMGDLFLEKLGQLEEKHLIIGDVRVKGLFACLELVENRETKKPLSSKLMKKLKQEALRKGIYFHTRLNMLLLAPPLIIKKNELIQGVDLIDKVLSIIER